MTTALIAAWCIFGGILNYVVCRWIMTRPFPSGGLPPAWSRSDRRMSLCIAILGCSAWPAVLAVVLVYAWTERLSDGPAAW